MHCLFLYMHYFREHYYLWLFCFHLENVGDCCKAQWVCVHQRIALYKSYLLCIIIITEFGIHASSQHSITCCEWCYAVIYEGQFSTDSCYLCACQKLLHSYQSEQDDFPIVVYSSFQRGVECMAKASRGSCSVADVDQAWHRYLQYIVTMRVVFANVTMNYPAMERVLMCSGEFSRTPSKRPP